MKINIKKWINGKFYKEITCGKSTIKLMAFTKKERAEIYGDDFLKELKKEIFINDFEKLADVQHEIWSHWMKYLFSIGSNNVEGFTIPAEKVERWKRQMNTKYKDLSEKEKESDREQVRKLFDVFS